MRALCAGVLGLLLAGLWPAGEAVADVVVRYDVESRPLRRHAGPADRLTFELYEDRECRVPVHRQALRLREVEVLRSEIARVHLEAGPRVTGVHNVARLRATLHSIDPRRGQYLRVRGPGIRPLGGACQPQGDGL